MFGYSKLIAALVFLRHQLILHHTLFHWLCKCVTSTQLVRDQYVT